MKFVRISEEFELSEFELTGVNYYKMYHQIQGELDLVRVSEVLLYYHLANSRFWVISIQQDTKFWSYFDFIPKSLSNQLALCKRAQIF